MAAGNFIVYGPALEAILKNTLDLDGATFRMVLLSASYTPNQGTHAAYSSLSAAELANGNGYATHGKLLTQTVTRSGAVVTFDVNDQSWPSSTLTAKYAAIVADANADGSLAAGDVPLAYCELEAGSTVSTTNGTLQVTINTSGVFTVTAAAS